MGAVVLLGAVVAVAVIAGSPAKPLEDAPPFRLPDLRQPDARIALADFRGRPLILNFWGSSCIPCRKEMPAFQRLHRRLGDQIVILGIDRLDNRHDALEFLRRTGVTYPSAYDREATLDEPYRLVGMPTTVFVSPAGRSWRGATGRQPRTRSWPRCAATSPTSRCPRATLAAIPDRHTP